MKARIAPTLAILLGSSLACDGDSLFDGVTGLVRDGGTAADVQLSAGLTGGAVVVGAGDADGAGEARLEVSPAGGLLCFEIEVRGIALPATGAAVHRGGAGVEGAPVVQLTPPDATGLAEGCFAVAPEVLAGIVADPAGHYVAIYTAEFGRGALRGQLGG